MPDRNLPRLNRRMPGMPEAPRVRMVHLGTGNFHRAHVYGGSHHAGDHRLLVARTQGYEDASPVPTEPFSEWVISGRFPAGRPAWQESGARLVDDGTLYEQRSGCRAGCSRRPRPYGCS